MAPKSRAMPFVLKTLSLSSTRGGSHHKRHNKTLPVPPHLHRRPPLRQPMPAPRGVLLLPSHHPPPHREPRRPPPPPGPLRHPPARGPLPHPVLHRRRPPPHRPPRDRPPPRPPPP